MMPGKRYSSGTPASSRHERVPLADGSWHSRGYLPHFDQAEAIQFITFRLHDSVPGEQIEQWKDELGWESYLSPSDPICLELRKKIAMFAEGGYGACYLRESQIAAIVESAMRHFDGERYRLLEWCIMPNHVHALIQTIPGYPLESIVHSWKSYSANRANRLLGRVGPFWMRDYFDRYIRDEQHYARVVEYIQSQRRGGAPASSRHE